MQLSMCLKMTAATYIRVLVILNLFDCVSTSILVFNGVEEGNPLIRLAIEQIGLVGIPVVKLIPLSIIIVLGVNRQGWVKSILACVCIIYAIVMFCVNLPLLICVIFS